MILTQLVLGLVLLKGTVDKQMLCKKWHLKKYVAFNTDSEPDENEKNDFLHLLPNMTYKSCDHGKHSKGNWILKEKQITLFNSKKQELKLFIIELTDTKLIVNFNIDKLKNVDVHFCLPN